ncbi:hypothetical protein XM25_18285 [Devosia sp. H5989]|nr:hypothetical protein XM25_18285 [Devosia sp. H5989]
MTVAIPRLADQPAFALGRALSLGLAAWRHRRARRLAFASLLDMNPHRLADLGLSADAIEAALAARRNPHFKEIRK